MFWGLVLEAGKRYSQDVETSFHITMAALEPPGGVVTSNSGAVSVMLVHEKTEYLICSLSPSLPQQPLDLLLSQGEEVTFFTTGKGTIHLTGSLEPELDDPDLCDPDFEEASDLEEEEDSVDDSEDDEEPSNFGKVKKMNNKQNRGSLKIVELPSSEEEENNNEEEEDDSDTDDESDLDITGASFIDDEAEEDSDEDSEEEEEVVKKKSKTKALTKKGLKELSQKSSTSLNTSSNSSLNEDSSKNSKKNKKRKRKQNQTNETEMNQAKNTNKENSQPKPKKKKQENGVPETTPKQNKQKKKTNSTDQKGVNSPAAGGENKKQPTGQSPSVTANRKVLPGGVVVTDLKEGHGTPLKHGKMAHVYYSGKLEKNDKQFDSCLNGKPFKFKFGMNEVIKGWDLGLAGMKVGGRRRIVVPPSSGYGSQSVGGIPANSTLKFDVELRSVS